MGLRRRSAITLTLWVVLGTGCRPALATPLPPRTTADPPGEPSSSRRPAPPVTVAQGPDRGDARQPPAAPPAAAPPAGTSPAGTPSITEALAAERRGDLLAAIGHYQGLLSRLQPPHQRVWLEARRGRLIRSLSAAQVTTLRARFGSQGRAQALLAGQLARLRLAAGQEQQARALVTRVGRGLAAHEQREVLGALGHPNRIGALVPLSGPLRALGVDLLRGMLLAADLTLRSRGPSATIVVRDSARDVGAGVRGLARQGVVAIVGVPYSKGARAAAPVSQQAGVVLITGADGKGIPSLGSVVFRGVHEPIARARALARYLARTGKVQRVAVVYPENAYGRRVSSAFVAEAVGGRMVVVARVAYKRNESNLYKRFGSIVSAGAQAVFVAESAMRLEIVAPQLALAGLQAAPLDRLGKGKVLLLSTAEGLRARLLKNVGHAVAGAILAPGFYPDASDPAVSTFVRAFTRVYGRPPGRYAAFGYGAVRSLRGLLVRKAQGRVSLRTALETVKDAQGQRVYTAQGERVNPPRLYRAGPGGIVRLTMGVSP